MKWHTITVAAICLCAIATFAQADDARATFNSLYGNQLKQVKSTRDRDDDTELAKLFVNAAKQSVNTPTLAAVLCNEAHDLTRLHEPAVALDAMRLLKQVSPSDRKAADENIIRLLTIQMRSTDATARAAAVNELIALQTDAGDAAFNANNFREASAVYRRVLALATRYQHKSAESLRRKIKATAARERILREVELLEEKVLRDADDQISLKELSLIYLLEIQQPAKASPYVKRLRDGELKSNMLLALREVTSLNAEDSLKLGDWSLKVSKEESGDRAAAARAIAHRSFTRFLLLHTTRDTKRTRAELLLKGIEAEVTKAGSSGASPHAAQTTYQPPRGMTPVISLLFDEESAQAAPKDSFTDSRAWWGDGTKTVPGVNGNARWFDGKFAHLGTSIRTLPQFHRKRMIVAAWIKPESNDGVIFAVGGTTRGYALYLSGGRLCFTARLHHKPHTVTAAKGFRRGWNHVIMDIQDDGKVVLGINKQITTGKLPNNLGAMPGESWTIGEDKGSSDVVNYNGKEHFKGAIDEFQMWISE